MTLKEAKKLKLEHKVKKQKQKQTQKQSVKQTVIVRLDEKHYKKRRVYKRKHRENMGGKEQPIQLTQPSLPPNVIYQSHQIMPVPFQVQTPTPITSPEPVQPRIEDIGQVGTEGPVKILDVPTKKETLAELITPVKQAGEAAKQREEQKQMRNEEMMSTLAKFNYPQPKNEKIAPTIPTIPITPQQATETKKRRNKTQMEEARQMGREDINSIQLGLSQFNYPPQSSIVKGINEPIPQLKGAEIAPKPLSDLSQYQDMSKPELYAPIPKKENPVSINEIISKMYGSKLADEQSIREQKRLRRNELAKARYAKKKEQQRPK